MRTSSLTSEYPAISRPSAEVVPVCRVCGAVLPRSAHWCAKCGLNTMSHVHGKLASPARRLFAMVIDYLIPTAAFIVAPRLTNGTDILEIVLLTYAAWALVLFSAGTTPGKRLLRIRVINVDGLPATLGRMIVREWVGKVISAGIGGLGYLGIVVDRERRALHDRIVHTYVIGVTK